MSLKSLCFKSATGLCLLGLASLGGWKGYCRWQSARPVTIFAWRLPSGPIFLAEDPQNPDLQAFARQERLADVVRPYKTDMERIVALCKWASKTFPDSTPFPNYPPWNASTILDWIRKGKTGGYCGQYGFVFGQACQSQGYLVRYVDVASPENNSGHFTVQVYVPSLNRWIVFEPTWGTYYVDETGNPLSMMDLHEFAVGKRKGKVLEWPTLKSVPEDRLHLFYFFRYYLRNNFLTVPVFARQYSDAWVFEQYRLAWIDSYTATPKNSYQAIPSDNLNDFRFRIDPDHPAKEIWVKERMQFINTLSSTPPLQMVKVHIPQDALTQLVRTVFVRDPSFHRLKG
jgi:hypothetical protein